eukprot:TRINITY_DN7428_c3_g1_i1.p1 TRINITY_DN7428_c3_g1~~TRINITY_DN7428_c3_g1_i1.p1  ORF type:complete len:469 (+),score=65.87 TRINITY_DN7428_c3_g1_i1:43-1449(+)
MSIQSDGDLPMPPGAGEAVAGDILLENAKRFAKRISGVGFPSYLKNDKGTRVMRIVGLGNPLLDVCSTVDVGYLDKYGLEYNGACVCEPKHKEVFDYLKSGKTEVTKVPGGSCLNTMRVTQWITQSPGATTFLGTVGDDEYGTSLRNEAQIDGLLFPPLIHPTLNTGTCAVLIADQQRSLVADLGASVHFSDKTLEQNPEVLQAIVQASIFYCEGFVFNASPDAIFKLALHAHAELKFFCMNISAAFVPGLHKRHWKRVLPYTHYLFGNGEEAIAFAEAFEWDTTEEEMEIRRQLGEIDPSVDRRVAAVALKLSLQYLADPDRARVVVLTQGANPTILARQGTIKLFPTPYMAVSEIVDTNGSGDAFVGGFLSQLSLGEDLAHCVSYGQRAAKEMLKTSGCTLPEKREMEFVRELASMESETDEEDSFEEPSALRSRALSISASACYVMNTSYSSNPAGGPRTCMDTP